MTRSRLRKLSVRSPHEGLGDDALDDLPDADPASDHPMRGREWALQGKQQNPSRDHVKSPNEGVRDMRFFYARQDLHVILI